MPHHVFVVMPFGEKEGIDFNRVYSDLIRPALEDADLEPFRADEEILPGDIRADMFQELLMADLVVAELSINNPNAWYELGVRHGLRAGGVIQIRCSTNALPFDVCVDRTLHYHIKDGVPDPQFLDADRLALATTARTTMESSRGRRISPVYQYLSYLQEPDWKSLRVTGADDFWKKQERWESLIEIARKKKRPGDILVLADEAPTNAFRMEGYRTAGKALRSLGQFAFALEQYGKALELDPDDLQCAQQKGVILGRMGRTEAADEWLRDLLEKHPHDAETWALLGRIEKDRWIASWWSSGKNREQMRADAAFEDAQLKAAIEAYKQGFHLQPDDYYAGINALALSYVSARLNEQEPDDDELKAMEGGVRWAVTSDLRNETARSKNYWARITLADLELLCSDTETVARAYKNAVVAADGDWFALDSSRQQLIFMRDLDLRREQVDVALDVLERAIAKQQKPLEAWTPRNVFLFSGHMIDAADRPTPRFPADRESVAAAAIEERLESLQAGAGDLAMCGGACGGDLLFARACLNRDMRLEMRLPFDVPRFLEKSVAFAGEHWRDLFYQASGHVNTSVLIMPQELGPTPHGVNPYERANLWQLYSAISWGPEKIRFLCLWDGESGDGTGGTDHMLESVKKRSGRVYVIDIHALFKKR